MFIILTVLKTNFHQNLKLRISFPFYFTAKFSAAAHPGRVQEVRKSKPGRNLLHDRNFLQDEQYRSVSNLNRFQNRYAMQ